MSLLPKICLRKWTSEHLHMLEDMTWGVQSHSPKSSLKHLPELVGSQNWSKVSQMVRRSESHTYPQCWTSVSHIESCRVFESCGMDIPKGLHPACTGVMKVSAVGTTQTLSWIFTAGLDTQCTAPCMANDQILFQWQTKRYGKDDHCWKLTQIAVLRVGWTESSPGHWKNDSNNQEGQHCVWTVVSKPRRDKTLVEGGVPILCSDSIHQFLRIYTCNPVSCQIPPDWIVSFMVDPWPRKGQAVGSLDGDLGENIISGPSISRW